MCHGRACSATFTAHVESLFCTVQQLLPVIFMKKPPNFENNTSLPTAKHGSLAQAPPGSRGSKFISVCRGGAKSFVFSHRQLRSVFVHKGSCLCISSDGKRVLRGSLEKFAATLSPLRVKGPDDPALLVGSQLSHSFAVRTCGFKH